MFRIWIGSGLQQQGDGSSFVLRHEGPAIAYTHFVSRCDILLSWVQRPNNR